MFEDVDKNTQYQQSNPKKPAKPNEKRKKYRAGYDTNTAEIESEILDTGDIVTGTNVNAKITEIENKICFNLVN